MFRHVEHRAHPHVVRRTGRQQVRVDNRQVADLRQPVERGLQRAEVELLAGVEVAQQVTLAQRVIVELVALHQRGDAVVGQVIADAADADLVVEPHREAAVDRLARALVKLDDQARVELVDVLVELELAVADDQRRLGMHRGRCEKAQQHPAAECGKRRTPARSPADGVAEFQR